MTVMMFAGEGDSVAPEPDYLLGDEILTEGSIFRSGKPNPSNLSDPDGLSFRDSLSDPIGPETKPVFTKDEYIQVDVSKLPEGSAVRDNNPPGHVTVRATPEQIKNAGLVKGKFPKPQVSPQ
jgi:hypothetical protein